MSTINACAFAVANTPGLGSITVGAAASGPFRALGAGHDGQSFTVAFYDGSAFEIARGCVYTHATTTLTRGTFEDSSTGAPLTLSAATTCAVVSSAGELAPLNSLGFTNVGTPEVPVWQLNANVLPRTDTLANLQALTSGGGELASATDVNAIVQLQGVSPAGTAHTYSPLNPGVLSADGGVLNSQSPNNLMLLRAGASGLGTNGSDIFIFPDGEYGALFPGGGNIRLQGAAAVSGNTLAGGSVTLTGGGGGTFTAGGAVSISGGATSASAQVAGGITLTAGRNNATATSTTGAAVNITGGRNDATNGNGGLVNITGGQAVTTGAGTGGDVILKPGIKSSAGVAGSVRLRDSLANNVVVVGPLNTLGFFNSTPVVKPAVTGSRGGNAALASLLTQLAALGLITDSSTA